MIRKANKEDHQAIRNILRLIIFELSESVDLDALDLYVLEERGVVLSFFFIHHVSLLVESENFMIVSYYTILGHEGFLGFHRHELNDWMTRVVHERRYHQYKVYSHERGRRTERITFHYSEKTRPNYSAVAAGE